MKKLHEKMESRKEEMMEHAKGREVPDTHFGDRKSAKDRLKHFKKKGILSKVFKKY
jgi:hypothetical protein